MTLRDNVVYATKDAGFHQHYGTDNLITNNIFAFSSTLPCDPAVAGQCDRAAVRSSQHMDCYDPRHPTHEAGCNSSFTFTNNIVLLGAESLGGAPANATTSVFMTETAYNQPSVNSLKNMTFAKNLYWSAALPDPLAALVFNTQFAPLNFTQWAATRDAGAALADPLFADAAAHNFTLLPGSPALALGFTNIDVSTVGPRFPWRRA